MEFVPNPHRGGDAILGAEIPFPDTDSEPVARLLAQCPAAAVTPLRPIPGLAAESGIAQIWVKDETVRMGLGSFKALGAAYAIAVQAASRIDVEWPTALAGRVFVAASAGNHGLSVAAGARIFGAQAVIVIAETVPESFARRLAAKGARVERRGVDYAQSMAEAEEMARKNGWDLVSDSSWPGYLEYPRLVMQGYLQMAVETVEALPDAPSHILLQAGVGGMAASIAAYAREHWGEKPVIAVVEPVAAPALLEAAKAGRIVTTEGPVSSMGRLDCKTASLIAFQGLARDADFFVSISDRDAEQAVASLAAHGVRTTPSGAAGFAPLAAARHAGALHLDSESRVLCFVTETADPS